MTMVKPSSTRTETSNLLGDPLPAEYAEALDRSRDRLGSLASRVIFFSTIGSTNDVASAIAGSGCDEGAVVIADSQTAGRGRRGHVWFSPPRSGLYVSVVLVPARARTDPQRATTLLTLSAGVALAEAVETATGLRVAVKWPNDLSVRGRKLAGILAEGVRSTNEIASVILGYGINVRPIAYPPELAGRATSVESELGRPIDRALLLADTLSALSRRYGDLIDGRFDAILDAWRGRAPASFGAHVSWTTSSGTCSGVTAGIDDQGALLVHVGQRIERIVAGEVTWLQP